MRRAGRRADRIVDFDGADINRRLDDAGKTEATLIDRMGVYLVDEDTTVADFAVRTCACGFKIDGFDEFMFHLTELARKEEE